MTAVFTQTSGTNGQVRSIRKAVGLEQEEGAWVIVRERELKTPVRSSVLTPPPNQNGAENPVRFRVLSLKQKVKP